jgi:plastocyanin
MHRNPKSLLVVLLLSVAILVAALPRRSTADSFLPLVLSGQGAATATLIPPTVPGTITATPTASPTNTATNTPTSPATSTQTPTPTSTSPAPSGSVITVTVGNNFFAPAAVTINPGDTVVWQRLSGFHNVAADDNSFRLGEPPNGGAGSNWTTVSRTFTDPGTFGYYCEIHGSPGGVDMAGTITVAN